MESAKRKRAGDLNKHSGEALKRFCSGGLSCVFNFEHLFPFSSIIIGEDLSTFIKSYPLVRKPDELNKCWKWAVHAGACVCVCWNKRWLCLNGRSEMWEQYNALLWIHANSSQPPLYGSLHWWPPSSGLRQGLSRVPQSNLLAPGLG